MAKLEIPVVVDIDAVAELIEELKDLQTYKLGAGDDLILVDRDAVVEIFAMHVKAKRREEWETGRWTYGEDEYGIDGYYCDKCGFFVPWDYAHKFINYIEDYRFCPNCGARMNGDAPPELARLEDDN